MISPVDINGSLLRVLAPELSHRSHDRLVFDGEAVLHGQDFLRRSRVRILPGHHPLEDVLLGGADPLQVRDREAAVHRGAGTDTNHPNEYLSKI